MINKFEEQVYKINELIRNDRLVVFVGSGVSINSGYPSWNELAEKYAKIYTNNKLDFTEITLTEVFENAYHKSAKKYYAELGNTFGRFESDQPVSSQIIDMILRLNPKHIITTNYDYLIEKSIKKAYLNFNKVVKDIDLVNDNRPRKYIKMHGDYENKEFIVLKESDYQDYNDTHPLIETYIKSILVDHTLLFIGYSYKDTNLRNILNWIEKRIKDNKEKKITHYFMNSGSYIEDSHDLLYLQNKNIEVMNFEDLASYSLFSEVDIPEDITFELGKNLFTMLYYIQANMATVEGLKYLLKNYEDINKMFPEDLIKYLNLNPYVRLVGNTIVRKEYVNLKYDWVTMLFERLEEQLRLNYQKDEDFQHINKVFRKSGITGFLDTSKKPHIHRRFGPEFIEGNRIIISLHNNDYTELNKIREKLSKNKRRDYYSLMQMLYLNELFHKSNENYIDELKSLRDSFIDTNNTLKLFTLSCNLDWLNIFKRDKVSTYKILKNLNEATQEMYEFAFAIITNIEKHEIKMTKAFSQAVFSDNTGYGMGYDPITVANSKITNFVKFHQENFLLNDFRNLNITNFVKYYLASMMSLLQIYNKEQNDSNKYTYVFQPKEEIIFTFDDLWMFSRYLSRKDIAQILNKYNIETIKVYFPEQLEIKMNNIIDSFSKFPYNLYIQNQYLSFLYLFLYLKPHHNLISTITDSIWVVFDNELSNITHNSYDNIVALFNAIIKTSVQFDKGKLLLQVMSKIKEDKDKNQYLANILTSISNNIVTEDIQNIELYRLTIDEIFEIYFNNNNNIILLALLSQLHLLNERQKIKLSSNVTKSVTNNLFIPSISNIFFMISSNFIDKNVFLPSIKKIYEKSSNLVNGDRTIIKYPDIDKDNVLNIELMIESGLIDDFRNKD